MAIIWAGTIITWVTFSLSMIGMGIPLVASEHIVPEYYRGRGLEFTMFKMGCRLSTRVTVLSEAVRDLYPPNLRNKMVPMPNPVVVHGHVTVDPVGEPGQPKTILSVGRLEHQKDHATLIEAFASIADRFPEWGLRIVGDGSLRAELESAIARLGLRDKVSLPGSTDRIDLEYSRAQILAVPSRFESFGMVTAEAQAVGLPVIGFADCPGTNELIQHKKNGWLASGGEGEDRVRGLAEGLSTLMADESLRVRLGAASPRRIREFGPEAVTSKWENLLSSVAAGR